MAPAPTTTTSAGWVIPQASGGGAAGDPPPDLDRGLALASGRLLGRGLAGRRLLRRSAADRLLGRGRGRGGRPHAPAELGRLAGAHDRVLEPLHRGDPGLLGGLDADLLAGGGVATHTGRALDLGELGEAADRHRLALRDDCRDDVLKTLQGGVHVPAVQTRMGRNSLDQITSIHLQISSMGATTGVIVVRPTPRGADSGRIPEHFYRPRAHRTTNRPEIQGLIAGTVRPCWNPTVWSSVVSGCRSGASPPPAASSSRPDWPTIRPVSASR